MTDDTQQQPEHHSRRFIKGVHRAFFTPVDPEDTVIQPTPVVLAPPQPPAKQDLASPEVVTPVPVQPQPVQQPAPLKPKRKKSPAKFIFFMLLGFLIAGVGGYSYYMYWNSQQQLERLRTASPQAYEDLQAETLVQRVGRHMELPSEVPLIRTLEGVDAKMRSDAFFAKAKDGDKVLVFSQRAILYDPAADKIIEVGAVRQTTPAPVASQTGTASAAPQVAGASTQSGKILINNDKH